MQNLSKDIYEASDKEDAKNRAAQRQRGATTRFVEGGERDFDSFLRACPRLTGDGSLSA